MQTSIEPVGIELPKSGAVRRARRLLRTGFVAGRRVGPALPLALLRRGSASAAMARGARRMFEDLGATYVKFGQFIASAPGIVGEQVAEEFRTTLDAGPAVGMRYVRAAVEEATGQPLEASFATFEVSPMAAASIAVVHRATLPDGRAVAVKVLRPGIEQRVSDDLGVLEPWVRFMAGRGVDQMYNLVGYVVGLKMQIAEELDLRNEARSMRVFRALFEEYGLDRLVVPEPHEHLSGRRVLTMELLDGVAIDDLSKAKEFGADPKPLVQDLLRAWMLTALRVNAFHADIHAGNLLLLRDGRLGMVDWGIVARLDPRTHTLFVRLIEASLGREQAWDDIADYMIEVQGSSMEALGLTREQMHRMIRVTMEPVLVKPLSEVSMAELFMTGDEVVRRATGEEPRKLGLRGRLRVMRDAARAYRHAARDGSFEHPTLRANFLAAKQLVYLERYGRMYMPEESILGDKDWLRQALAEEKEKSSGAAAEPALEA